METKEVFIEHDIQSDYNILATTEFFIHPVPIEVQNPTL